MAPIAVITAALVGLGFVLLSFFNEKQHPQEPPLVRSRFPLVGHLLGLMRHGYDYYPNLSRCHKWPIFTTNLFGQKTYTVCSLDLIQAIQKLPTDLAFFPISANVASTACDVSSQADDVFAANEHAVFMEMNRETRNVLKPGPSLDTMSRAMLENLLWRCDSLSSKTPRTVPLALLLRSMVTEVTTGSVYGPHNPYGDSSIAESFWDFTHGIMYLIVGVLPSLCACKAIASRTRISNAFRVYFRNGHHNEGSALAKVRHSVKVERGVPMADIAKVAAIETTAFVHNTSPATFWLVFHIFSCPDLLRNIRREVDTVTNSHAVSATGDLVRTIDFAKLKQHCPLLISTFKETLRCRSMGTSVRTVTRDVSISNGRWLLKKGAIVQMPSRIIHSNPDLWGKNVDTFDPQRFQGSIGSAGSDTRPREAWLRTFGGGQAVCPGRHFATNEILAFAALFVGRFDLRPLGTSGGAWKTPTTAGTTFVSAIMGPDTDVMVEISGRKDAEKASWRICESNAYGTAGEAEEAATTCGQIV